MKSKHQKRLEAAERLIESIEALFKRPPVCHYIIWKPDKELIRSKMRAYAAIPLSKEDTRRLTNRLRKFRPDIESYIGVDLPWSL